MSLYLKVATNRMTGRWGDGAMGRRGDGETGRRGDGETGRKICSKDLGNWYEVLTIATASRSLMEIDGITNDKRPNLPYFRRERRLHVIRIVNHYTRFFVKNSILGTLIRSGGIESKLICPTG
ncbi:MAG TPA: hypothetical protein V6C85_39210 [Allocoleopsis sp.]